MTADNDPRFAEDQSSAEMVSSTGDLSNDALEYFEINISTADDRNNLFAFELIFTL